MQIKQKSLCVRRSVGKLALLLSVCFATSAQANPAGQVSNNSNQTKQTNAEQNDITPPNPEQVTIQPLQTSIKEEHFQTLLVIKALQKLGYKVKPPKTVTYEQAHAMIAKGEGTFFAAHWDPLHRKFYDQYGGDKVFWRANNYIPKALQGYLIDRNTANRYHIKNLEQLKNPEIAKLFDHNNDGKAELVGCNKGWGCDAMITHHIQEYKLTNTVQILSSDYNKSMQTVLQRYREGKPVLFYTWTPNWVSHELRPGKDVIWLQVPYMALSDQDLMKRKAPKGKSHGFPTNYIRILANRSMIQKHPMLLHLFHSMHLTTKEISKQNKEIFDGRGSPADIDAFTDNWINEHRRIFTSWINHAAKNRNNQHSYP